MDGELGPEHKEVLNFTQVLFHSLVTRLLYVCLSLFISLIISCKIVVAMQLNFVVAKLLYNLLYLSYRARV